MLLPDPVVDGDDGAQDALYLRVRQHPGYFLEKCAETSAPPDKRFVVGRIAFVYGQSAGVAPSLFRPPPSASIAHDRTLRPMTDIRRGALNLGVLHPLDAVEALPTSSVSSRR